MFIREMITWLDLEVKEGKGDILAERKWEGSETGDLLRQRMALKELEREGGRSSLESRLSELQSLAMDSWW